MDSLFKLPFSTFIPFFAICAVWAISIFIRRLIEPAAASETLDLLSFRNCSIRFFRNLCVDFVGPYERKVLADGTETQRIFARIQNRAVRLNLRNPTIKNDSATRLEVLEIRIKVRQKFSFRLRRKIANDESIERLTLGIEWFDSRYRLHSNQSEVAIDFVRRFSIQQHLLNFPCAIDHMEVNKGELCLTLFEPRLWEMTHTHLAIIMEELLAIIKEYEVHRPMKIWLTVLESNSKCPYCKNGIGKYSEAIIRCLRCSTQLHSSCWNENGKCTTWGCRSSIAVTTLQLG